MFRIKTLKIPDEYKYISAFLTTRCNLRCSYCLNEFDENFQRNQALEEISGEEWVKSLNRLESRPDVPVTFSGGEPFLHRDFIHIINNLKKDLNIDILTNLQWGEKGMDRFIAEVEPGRIRRNAPYASIRVSYHPEQMDVTKLAENVKKMQNAGFSIGVWAVLFPGPEQLTKINEAQFVFKEHGIDFRLKEYTGQYKDEEYGNYSKYPLAASRQMRRSVECRTTELLIGHDGKVYRCHSDLFAKENSIGRITDQNFEIENILRPCDKYGFCHPCDVKVKTNNKQQIGHTSVEIKYKS